jgi:hypothetical protein
LCHENMEQVRMVVHALIRGKTVGAQFIGAPPIYRLWFSPTHVPHASHGMLTMHTWRL